MATTYTKQFPLEASQSLAAEGRNLEFARKAPEHRTSMVNDGRLTSERVLREVVARAMKSALEKVAGMNAPPHHSLHTDAYGWLRQPSRAGELTSPSHSL